MTEFDLIERYFVRPGKRNDVDVDIGDDAAVCSVPDGQQIVLTTDLFIVGVHFPEDTPAQAIGHKALAISLSDLAAMAATPAWFTLNLSLPGIDEKWLQDFSQAMFALADEHHISLVGGDTTKGPLSISIQACGLIPTGSAILRSGARAGDQIYVTGSLGDAALGLRCLQDNLELPQGACDYLVSRLYSPAPRSAQGVALRQIATAMIDISDGLAADLSHILVHSGVGATIRQEAVPLSEFYRHNLDALGFGAALTGGDDYELCFTVPAEKTDELHAASEKWECIISCIGEIESGDGLRIKNKNGQMVELGQLGYEHFTNDSK